MTIDYDTRDGEGNDYIKKVVIKEYQQHELKPYLCPICHQEKNVGIDIKDIVSGCFTDWAFIGNSKYICPECSRYFSLNFYNYVIDSDGIHLYNIRRLKDELIRPQKPPFMFCISTTQKKHLFYKAKWNYSSSPFCANLETETICTTIPKMKELFPNDEERIQHIVGKQVFGAAPSEIIYRIATHYILGFSDSLPDDIKTKVFEVQAKAGFVPNVFLGLARRPAEWRAFFAYHDALMEPESVGRTSHLSKGDREMIVTTTSAANQCLYCVVAHGALLRIYEKKPHVADQVAVNYRKAADITPRQRAMLDFAMKVCERSNEINDDDFTALHAHGFDDTH